MVFKGYSLVINHALRENVIKVKSFAPPVVKQCFMSYAFISQYHTLRTEKDPL